MSDVEAPPPPVLHSSEPTATALPLSQWAILDDHSPATEAALDGLDKPKQSPLLSYGTAPSAPPAEQPLQPSGAFYPAPQGPQGAFFPPPQAVAPLSAGPPLTAPAFGGWGVAAMLFNAAVVALLVCVGLNVGGKRNEYSGAAAASYFIYLLVCLCSPSARALRNHMSTSELLDYTQAVRSTRPVLWASIVCYHYETRTRVVSRTDKDGKRHTHTGAPPARQAPCAPPATAGALSSTCARPPPPPHTHSPFHLRAAETYTEKVVTHSASANWAYGTCRDISGPPVYQPHISMLQIHFKPVQDFLDSASASAWVAWRSHFYASNTRDAHQDRSSGMRIDGLKSWVMLQQGTSFWVGPGGHTLAVLLGIGIFFECLVFQKTPHTKYHIVKQLSIY